MQGGAGESRGASPFPPDALPCVWMTAGLIAYRLCDREYDCDSCPLDLALRGGAGSLPLERAPAPGAIWDFPDDRQYSPLHEWVLDIGAASRLRVGLDAFAARLLDHADRVVFPPTNAGVQRGRSACWILDEGELIPICSPLTGTVVGTNLRLGTDPALVASSPYEEGWLMEIQAREPLERQQGLLGARAARERTTLQLRQLHRRACAGLARDGTVGMTLTDGGVRISDLRRTLGTDRYHRLILPFLR